MGAASYSFSVLQKVPQGATQPHGTSVEAFAESKVQVHDPQCAELPNRPHSPYSMYGLSGREMIKSF